METALKQIVVTDLRRRGFTGSLPHLRRRMQDRIDLLSFQFRSTGGSFVVEVAVCGPDGIVMSWGKHIPPAKVRAVDMNSNRPRLGADHFPTGDHWFVFGSPNYEQESRPLPPSSFYDSIAVEVLQLVDQQAEPFWSEGPRDPSTR